MLGGGAPRPAIAVAAPLSRRLREFTRAAHERVENGAGFNHLVIVRIPPLAPDAPAVERARRERALVDYREVYRRFLIASHGFEASVLERLAASPIRDAAYASGYQDEPADSVALIELDLAFLEAMADLAGAPTMAGVPEATTLPAWVGIEYVRRGSRAGGALIGHIAGQNLGLGPDGGASFLGLYGRATREALDRLRGWIDSIAFSESERDEAVAVALATFEAVGRWHRLLEDGFAGAGRS